MQFAKRARAGNRGGGDDDSPPAAQHEQPQLEQQQAASDEEEARRRIMDMARRVNAGRGIAGGAAAASADSSQQQSNALLAQLHAERAARQRARGGGDGEQAQQRQQQRGGGASQQAQQRELTILTYNLWFQEEVHVEQRMAAVADIVAARRPDVLCFQEVTPLIRSLLESAPWWCDYEASPAPGQPYFTTLLWRRASVAGARYSALPFENSKMGRDVKAVTGQVNGATVTVATSHLESPTGRNQLWSDVRVAQAKMGAAVLDRSPGDVLWLGDMNWGEQADGEPPLPAGWQDAWLELRPGDPGLTYDPRANPMLRPNNRIRRRLDRCWGRLLAWRLASIEMLGQEQIPGIKWEGRPVLPSDHFGLLVKLNLAA